MLFAIVNRELVAFSLFPLPYILELPKFLFVLILFVLGYLAGALIVGMHVARLKRELKAREKRIAALENEVTARRAEQNAGLPITVPDTPTHTV